MSQRSGFTIPHLQHCLDRIPVDKVTTYAELAKALGSPKAARAAGNLLNKNPLPDQHPCFRVVKSDGAIGGYALGKVEKIRRLENAGIEVKNERIVGFAARRFVFPKE